MKSSPPLQGLMWGCILSLFLLFPVNGLCSDPSLAPLLEDIRQKSATLTALSCTFTQKRSLAMFKKPIVFQGRLFLIRPEKLRWEFITPIPSVLIFNGDRGMRCSKDGEPNSFILSKDPVMRMVAQQLWTWLDGDYSKLEKNYTIEKTGDSAIRVKPTEKDIAQTIRDISITFDKKTRQPNSVTIAETGGDETLITFSAYQLNPPIPDSTFTQCFPVE